MNIPETLLWSFRQNYHADKMNAAIHTAPVRFSPITFRLAETLGDIIDADGMTDGDLGKDYGPVHEVLRDKGAYAEDVGR
jgi:hypothetical protein